MEKEKKVLIKWFFYLFILGLLICNFQKIVLFTDYRVLKYVLAEDEEVILEGSILNIPEIGLRAPLVFVKEGEEIEQALKRGVVHYPGSSLPGDGTSILLGHSAPRGWPKKNNFLWVFSELNSLNEGDKFTLLFNDNKYFYKITEKYFLEKGKNLADFETDLILISCWPPGKNSQRIVLEAKLR